jgi:SAM-dependent methyltransferase
VDGAVSIHVIYHVPEDKQLTAIRELHRVLKPVSSAAIVYSWGAHSSLLINFLLFPIKLKKALRNLLQKLRSFAKSILRKLSKQQAKPRASLSEKPYHHTHDYDYFVSQLRDIKLSILVWRSVGTAFTRNYIHNWFFGKQIMRWIFHLENRYPRLAGRIGEYPLFVIEK